MLSVQKKQAFIDDSIALARDFVSKFQAFLQCDESNIRYYSPNSLDSGITSSAQVTDVLTVPGKFVSDSFFYLRVGILFQSSVSALMLGFRSFEGHKVVRLRAGDKYSDHDCTESCEPAFDAVVDDIGRRLDGTLATFVEFDGANVKIDFA